MPAGYSGTPLARKLGIKPGTRVATIGAPDIADIFPTPTSARHRRSLESTPRRPRIPGSENPPSPKPAPSGPPQCLAVLPAAAPSTTFRPCTRS